MQTHTHAHTYLICTGKNTTHKHLLHLPHAYVQIKTHTHTHTHSMQACKINIFTCVHINAFMATIKNDTWFKQSYTETHMQTHIYTHKLSLTHTHTHMHKPSCWLQRPDVIMASCMLMLLTGTPLSAPQYSTQAAPASF